MTQISSGPVFWTTARLEKPGLQPQKDQTPTKKSTGGTLSFHQALVPKSALADYPQQVTWHEIGSIRRSYGPKK